MVQSDRRSQRLGRGLSSLIPPKPATQDVEQQTPESNFVEVSVDQVLPSDSQPRQHFSEGSLDELAASIREHGVLQPILIRKRPGGFELIAGERRWRAAKRAGLPKIPAVQVDLASKDLLAVAIVENIQREDLNPIEQAEAYQRMVTELKMSQVEIAKAVGKERPTVANMLRLLRLPLAVRQLVVDKEISMGHARALLALEDDEQIVALATDISDRGLSVRAVENTIKAMVRSDRPTKTDATPQTATSSTARQDAETDAIRDVRLKLQRALSTKVSVSVRNDGSGSIAIQFSSNEELGRIIETIER